MGSELDDYGTPDSEFESLRTTLASRDEEVKGLEAQLLAVRNIIPMNFLQRHDAPGATGPTAKLDLVSVIRDMVNQARGWEAKARALRESGKEKDALRGEGADGKGVG